MARYGISSRGPGFIETELNIEFSAEEAGRASIRRVPRAPGGFMTGSAIPAVGGHMVFSL